MTDKSKETEIVVVLDRSGSMGSIAPSIVEGFNSFLNEQQNAEGEAYMTLVQFDDRYELNYQSINVKEVQPLILGETFTPRGGTALLDAIGKTIEETKTDRDVVFVIITDGEENSSKVYKNEAISNMIESLEKEDGWKFIFLAANQDAIKTGSSYGVKGSRSITWTSNSVGAFKAFDTVNKNMRSYRSAKFSGDLASSASTLDFSPEQREDNLSK